MSDNKIILSIIPQEERFSFLPSMFGNKSFMEGEAMVYDHMSRFCADYTGGYWQYARLSNGGCVMLPEMDEKHVRFCITDNFHESVMTPEAAGIACCLYVLSHLSFALYEKKPDECELVSERFHQLRDFALEHPERELILDAID